MKVVELHCHIDGTGQTSAQVAARLSEHARSLQGQGVSYAEVMISGQLFPRGETDDPLARFESFREAAVPVQIIVVIGRGPLERAQRQAGRIRELARCGLICGVAIAGDEKACTIESIRSVIDSLRDEGLGIEIHAGEQAGPESVRDAIEHGRPHRIGHGVRAFEDERVVDMLRGVHVEFCPTSNLRLGVVSELGQLPLRRARELGLGFSINTDDPGLCSMRSELELVRGVFGFTDDDLAAIGESAWNARFTSRRG